MKFWYRLQNKPNDESASFVGGATPNCSTSNRSKRVQCLATCSWKRIKKQLLVNEYSTSNMLTSVTPVQPFKFNTRNSDAENCAKRTIDTSVTPRAVANLLNTNRTAITWRTNGCGPVRTWWIQRPTGAIAHSTPTIRDQHQSLSIVQSTIDEDHALEPSRKKNGCTNQSRKNTPIQAQH